MKVFEIIFILVLAAFAAGGIWAYVVTKRVKNDGIVTEAVVSRVELHEWSGGTGDLWAADSFTEEYYITYINRDGQMVEAMLTNPGNRSFVVGDRMKIKYLPDRQEYPVMIEVL